jgi:uncharacterized protein YndB with AHSA1/START domain
MSRHEFSTYIAASPERVFDLWTDLDRMTEWVGGVTRISDVSGPVDRAGTTYVVWFGRMASRTQVLDAERPKRIRTRFGNRILRGTSEATFESVGAGTQLTQRMETEGLVATIMGRIFAMGSYEGSFRGELAKFAGIAEREAAAEDPTTA